jgi:hypothetical protein
VSQAGTRRLSAVSVLGATPVAAARTDAESVTPDHHGDAYLHLAGMASDERVAEAVELVASKRDGDGRWPLETRHPGRMPVETDEALGRPSRWNTLRALRVLRWREQAGS